MPQDVVSCLARSRRVVRGRANQPGRGRRARLQGRRDLEGVEAPGPPLDGAVQAVGLARRALTGLPPQLRHGAHAHPSRRRLRSSRSQAGNVHLSCTPRSVPAAVP